MEEKLVDLISSSVKFVKSYNTTSCGNSVGRILNSYKLPPTKLAASCTAWGCRGHNAETDWGTRSPLFPASLRRCTLGRRGFRRRLASKRAWKSSNGYVIANCHFHLLTSIECEVFRAGVPSFDRRASRPLRRWFAKGRSGRFRNRRWKCQFQIRALYGWPSVMGKICV